MKRVVPWMLAVVAATVFCFYPLRGAAQNMERAIVLTVKAGANIKLQFAADAANTSVKVVSGKKEEAVVVGTTKSDEASFQVADDATTMTIYGDVSLLICRQNGENLTSIDLSKNKGLTELRCYSNKIEALDVSMLAELEALFCYDNPIKTLDVSKNTKLKTLACRNMELKQLDVTNNTALVDLLCRDNQLTTLDISKNVNLMQLYCSNNNFSTEEWDKLFCSLPDRNASNKAGTIAPLFNDKDPAKETVLATNKNNAVSKLWKVCYNNDKPIPATTGKYSCDGSTTGIPNDLFAEVVVTPNPFKDLLQVKNSTEQSLVYELLNAQGVVLETGRVVSGTSQLNTSHLPAGFYFLQLNATNGAKKTIRLVKE